VKPTSNWRSRSARSLLVVLLSLPGSIMAEQPSASFPPDVVARLQDAKEIYVATERKNGTRSQVVPVWFGFMDNAIWFTTGPDSHKGKRVKNGSPMYVSVQGKDGPFIKTQAEIVKDGAIADRLGELYSKKYWIAWLGFFRPSRARNESGKTILLRLTPGP
jgi:pyridoxamine 5'-phosphate oxidase-like protein